MEDSESADYATAADILTSVVYEFAKYTLINCLVLIMIQDIKILLQIGKITFILTFPFLLQDSKFAVKEESEECKNYDEHVDIKHEINPITQLTATTSEVRQGCEYIYRPTYSDNDSFSK